MRYSTQIKPISYLKANAAEVLQDVASYEATQEALALFKILALGNQQIEQGKIRPIADVARRMRARCRCRR